MKNNKSYSRKCIFTGEILEIDKLLRFTKNKSNIVIFDKNKNLQGRGSYLKNDFEIVTKALDKKSFNRSFKMNISKENYEELRKEVILFYGKN